MKIFHYRPILILTGILIFTLSIKQCGRLTDPWIPGFSYETVYVDSVFVADSAAVLTPVSIRVKGGMPDPSWSFERFDISTAGNAVIVRPVGKHDLKAGAVAAVIVPYDETFTYTFSRSGSWALRIQGRARTIEETIVIMNL